MSLPRLPTKGTKGASRSPPPWIKKSWRSRSITTISRWLKGATRRVNPEREFNKSGWRGVSVHMEAEYGVIANDLSFYWISFAGTEFRFRPAYAGETAREEPEQATGDGNSNQSGHWCERLIEAATVLATNGGTVLKFADRIETGIPGRLAFSGVPANLRDTPTLVISLINTVAGEQNLELSYLTAGMSWRADYVVELNERDDRLDLNGWVTLTNQSGAAYPNARLQLVAGDLNRVRSRPPMLREPMAMAAKIPDMEDLKQEALFEYHLYTLQRPTTLSENQTKQVALLSATNVSIQKEFLLAGASHYYFGQYGRCWPEAESGGICGIPE